MSISARTALQPTDLLELYNSAYQTGYSEAIADLQIEIDEDPTELEKFCLGYIQTESVDFTNQNDLEEYMIQYSYKLLSQYVK